METSEAEIKKIEDSYRIVWWCCIGFILLIIVTCFFQTNKYREENRILKTKVFNQKTEILKLHNYANQLHDWRLIIKRANNKEIRNEIINTKKNRLHKLNK
jgi:hypothetical protein